MFEDHHFFTHEDINEILIECAKNDAIVVCSEKDMVKIKKVTKDSRFLSINIEVEFLSGEEELLEKITKILHLDYQ